MVEDSSKKIDLLKAALVSAKLPNPDKLAKKYINAASNDYLVSYSANEIARDIRVMETLSQESQYKVSLGIAPRQKQKDLWRIKLFKVNDQVSLSRGLPIIENFGFKLLEEHPFKIQAGRDGVIHICDFGVIVPPAVEDKVHDKKLVIALNDAIVAAFNRHIENDKLNQLVLFSGLSAHQVVLLRAIIHYCVQTALPFSRAYMTDVMCAYPKIAHNLFYLFEARFNVKNHNEARAQQIHEEIMLELNAVTSLDDDRILKAFLAVVDAMIRTNYYQVDDVVGGYKEYISFKLESGKLPFLPQPVPLYEIFVYSTRFEAIHLRSGKVARGGFRWSDRREDFRTEILGLVKAQVVKNSVIVPTGSKGGFVCKKLPAITEREAYMAEGIFCYKQFIAGLLDITDNLVAGKIIPPKNVVRYDGDDPYLVVAADKGTATFSDYANEMSQKYGFWLGDAFASGGSAGYDHKKMGITARGAWESAKRHFRHLGINIQEQDFTVIGVGDMAGDVFGNGMLLSEHICLIAAFNHQHIFLDPNPDSKLSFIERQRMYNLPRSSWADYDKTKISQGGGVYERSVKAITLSPEVQKWLNVTDSAMSPNELIHAILQAKADLLYNGGIGTY
ncbi:MAG: NAD-glutamate dehydrogenase, partial [Burkholderiales bacterium]|nr:NAD-glutamate dehydrogenase [Burkholderiales bacterium]